MKMDGAGGGSFMADGVEPISIPTASERVTVGFEIGFGSGSVEVELEVAFGVEPISIPTASERSVSSSTSVPIAALSSAVVAWDE